MSTSIPTASFDFSVNPPAGVAVSSMPLASFVFTGNATAFSWKMQADVMYSARTIYTMTLTGDEDGLDDLEIPIASFQSRVRSGAYSYLSCVVPNSIEYASAIAVRPNGRIVIRMGYELPDGTRNLDMINWANFDTFRFDRGSKSDSATIVGYRYTGVPTSSVRRNVQGVSYLGLQADGYRRIRAGMDLFLRIGDVAIYGDLPGEELIVRGITYSVSSKPPRATMEVTESG